MITMLNVLKIWGRLASDVIGLMVLASMGVSTVAWFSPSGVGETVKSPDGRFVAYAFNMHQNRLFQEPLRYLQLTVMDSADREVWRTEYHAHKPIDESGSSAYQPTDFTIRGAATKIRWDADSRSVLFPLGSGRTMTVSVP
jgi:hypothetical protein